MADGKIKGTILLVEDEMGIASAISDSLRQEGYKVLLGSDGREGLAIALAQHPDLILADVKMPIMNGIDMVEKIRQDEAWGKSVAVVYLTNVLDEGLINDAVTEGDFSYIIKGDSSVASVITRVNAILHKNILAPAPPNAGAAEARAQGQSAEITYEE